MNPKGDILFEVLTPLGFTVRVTHERWRVISTFKHPATAGREEAVRATLARPDQIRRSRSDPEVLLFYRRDGRWVCGVTKLVAGSGFLITAYPTDAIKEGTQIWPT